MNEGVQRGMKDGWVRPIVQKTYQLLDAYKAHQDVIENSGSRGKLVVNCQQEDCSSDSFGGFTENFIFTTFFYASVLEILDFYMI